MIHKNSSSVESMKIRSQVWNFVELSMPLIYWICCVSLFLQEVKKLKNDKNNIGLQRSMWLDLNRLLSVKIECHRDAIERGAGGTLSVNKGAETFTLS